MKRDSSERPARAQAGFRVPVVPKLLEDKSKLENMTDAVAEMFARFCRCSEGVYLVRPNTGGVYYAITSPPDYRCNGCHVMMSSPRWLCSACRNQKLTLRNGKTYIGCSYDGKMISTELRKGGDKWRACVLLECQLSEAHAVVKLTKYVTAVCDNLIVQQHNGSNFQVSLKDLAVDVYAGWQRPLGTPQEDWHLHSYGAAVQIAVEEQVREWIGRLDAAICKEHDLSMSFPTREDEARMTSVRNELCKLLAARMSLTEFCEPHKRFSTEKLELYNKLEFTMVDISAPAVAKAERQMIVTLWSALDQALCIIQEEEANEHSHPYMAPEEDHLLQLEQAPERYAALLNASTAPHELDLHMCVAAFPGAIDNLECLLKECTGDDLTWNLFQWLQSFRQVATLLVHALQSAQRRVENWLVSKRSPQNYFVETLRIRRGQSPHVGTMPLPTWFTLSVGCDMVTKTHAGRRRLGLSSVGERIVRLCSALWQLEGEGVFNVPKMHASFLRDITCDHRERALCSCDALFQRSHHNQLGQLYERTHNAIITQDALCEDDIRGALASVAGFTLQEIGTFFSLVLPKKKDAIADMVVAKMPEVASTPWANYRDFLQELLPMASYLLKTQRLAFRGAPIVKLSKNAEVLRSIRRIRELEREGKLYDSPELILDLVEDLPIRSTGRDFLEACAERHVLCQKQRVTSKMRVVVNTNDLRSLLWGAPLADNQIGQDNS